MGALKRALSERSYSVKSPSSPRKALCKALCKVLVKSSFSMGALSHGCTQKSAFGSAFVNSYGALSEHFRSAFRGLLERFQSAFGDFRERLRERFRESFTRIKLLKCKRSKALGALSYI